MRVYFLGLLLLIVGCVTLPANQTEVPAHYRGASTSDGFKNLYIEDVEKNIFDFLKMKLFEDHDWADQAALADTVPRQQIDLALLKNPPQDQITWLGHSTFLIQSNGLNILTDPIFSDRASPVSFAGPKRYVPHLVNYAEMPFIDHVIISHNHYDHLDEATIKQLGSDTVYHVPLELSGTIRAWFSKDNQPNIIEYDWWQEQQLAGVSFKALPSQHWSARGLFDRMDTLWASWLIEVAEHRIYFGGDTGYNERLFTEIGQAIDYVDLALLPIGSYAPRSFMQDFHVNPEEAVLIHKHLNVRRSIGMHFGTFPLAAEAPMEPVERLVSLMDKTENEAVDFGTMTMGQTSKLNLDETRLAEAGQ